MIRLLIADDHRIFLQGLRRLLTDHSDLQVVAEAANYAEVIAAVRSRNLDVALLDLSMPGRDGAEMIGHVKALKPALKILVLTMHKEDALVMRALRAGTDGYMLKENAAEELVDVIRQLVRGGRYVCPEIAERIALAIPGGAREEAAHARLTEREYKVFQMLVTGKRGSEIAQELCLSEKTVSTHKAHVLRKMNLNNSAELIVYAVKHQLIQV